MSAYLHAFLEETHVRNQPIQPNLAEQSSHIIHYQKSFLGYVFKTNSWMQEKTTILF